MSKPSYLGAGVASVGKNCRPHNHGRYTIRNGKAFCRECKGYIGEVRAKEGPGK